MQWYAKLIRDFRYYIYYNYIQSWLMTYPSTYDGHVFSLCVQQCVFFLQVTPGPVQADGAAVRHCAGLCRVRPAAQ